HLDVGRRPRCRHQPCPRVGAKSMQRLITLIHRLDYHLYRTFQSIQGVFFPLLVVLALATLSLGFIGNIQLAEQRGWVHSWQDDLYRTLRLFTLEGPATNDPIPWSLDLARFLAAAFTFSTVLSVVGAVFYGQLQATRLWLLGHHHVVLAGLGEKGVK